MKKATMYHPENASSISITEEMIPKIGTKLINIDVRLGPICFTLILNRVYAIAAANIPMYAKFHHVAEDMWVVGVLACSDRARKAKIIHPKNDAQN